MYFVYMALCKDGSIYTGSTNDVPRRFIQHQAGKGGSYTRSHAVKKIIHIEQFSSKGEALRREAQIKRLPRMRKLGLASSHEA